MNFQATKNPRSDYRVPMFLTLVSILFCTTPVSAKDDDHDHGPGPNGGVIGEFQDHHVEAIVADTAAGFYILDGDEATKVTKIKSHGKGLLIVVPKKGKIIKKKIAAGKNLSEIFVNIKKGIQIKKMKLRLKIKGKTVKTTVNF